MKKILLWLLVLLLGAGTAFALPPGPSGFKLEEVDGSPAGFVGKLKMPNGTVTSITSGEGTIDLSSLGGGTVNGVGDCTTSADCLDGTSDGGTYIRLFDGTSAYESLTGGVRTFSFASSTADAENMVLTLGSNDNTLGLSSGTGANILNLTGLDLLVAGGDITLISATAGAGITGGDGTISLKGLGSGTDEILTIDLNSANLITLASSTDATFALTPSVAFSNGLVVADTKTLTFDESAAEPNDADVVLSGADGVLTVAAANGANNENLTIDLDATSNVVAFNSGTSATFTLTPATTITGQLTLSANPRIYDGDSHYLTLDVADLSGAVTMIVGATFTDTKWCSYSSTNGLTCNEDAPSSAAADVISVGDCTAGACLDGSSDGGTYVRLYDSDSHYTEVKAGNSTGNVAIILPTADGTSGQYLKTDGSGQWSWGDPSGSGDVTAIGDCASGACFTEAGGHAGTLYFEGSTANDYEIALTGANASADRTITLPDETGSVVVAASAFATDNRVLRSDGTGVSAQSTGITVDDSNNVSGIGTLGLTGAVTISANSAAITHSGSTTLAIASTSGTVSVEGSTFTGDALGLAGPITLSANSAAITHSGSTTMAIASTSGTVSVEGITFTGDAVTGASNVTSTKFTSTELEYSGNITVDAINAAADSTVTIGNSAATYNANLTVDGDATIQGADVVLISATAGAGITGGDGTLTLKGLGSGQDEDLTFDFNGTANTVVLTSSSGAATINANAFVISSNGLVPDAADGAALGSTSAEWSDIYLADGAIIYGQADQSNTLTSSATAWTASGNLSADAFVPSEAANAAGEFGYTSNAFSWFGGATSEDLTLTFGSNLATFASGTGAVVAFTPAVTLTGGISSIGAASNLSGGTLTLGAIVGTINAGSATSLAFPATLSNAAASTWTMVDNNASGLSLGSTGKADILKLVTTDSSEGVTMSGTLGVTGATTLTGALAANGNVTTGDADTDTLTIRSLIVGGNSRAVWIAGSAPTPTYATGTNDLYVGDAIEAAGTVYAAAFVGSTGTDGQRRMDFTSNTSFTCSGNQLYFLNNVAYLCENGTGSSIVLPADSVTWTGTSHSFAGVTNMVLPSATPDAAGEVGFAAAGWAASHGAMQVYSGTENTYVVATVASDSPSNGQVPKWNTGGTITWEDDTSAGSPALNTVADPAADTTWTFDAGEELSLQFTGNFTTGSQVLIQQQTGNPSGGVLFEVRGADTDPALVRFGDGTNYLQISNTGNVTHAGTSLFTAPRVTTSIAPSANDGATLGTTSLGFADLHLATGGTINWVNGDVVLTHSSNTLTLSGGDLALNTNNITGVTGIGATYIALGTDPADAGSVRLPNASYIMAEADAAGTDVSVIGVDSSEVVQIGASGASGVTITPDTTITGDLTVGGADLTLLSTGVKFTAANGVLTLLGTGDGADENLTIDLNTSSNVVTIASGTSATFTITPALTLTGGFISNGQSKLYSANADPTGTAGYIIHDSTVTNFTGGALRYHNGSAIKQLVDMTAATAEACTDDQVVAYDADADLWYCKADANSGGATAFDDVGDPDAAVLIEMSDGETVTFDGANVDETFVTISLNTADLGSDTTGLLITAVDNDDANYIPFVIQDDQDGTPDTLFKVDYQGTITLANGETITNTTDTQIQFTGDESLIIDLDTATDNEIGISSGSSATQINFGTLNMVTTGSILGALKVITDANDYTVQTAEAYGGFGVSTGAGTWTLPAVAAGMSFCVVATGAHNVIIDVDGSDAIILNGAAESNGEAIDSGDTAGEYACLVGISDSQWIVVGKSGSWTAE